MLKNLIFYFHILMSYERKGNVKEVLYHEDLLNGMYLSSSQCKPALVHFLTFLLTLILLLNKVCS